jgi:hypothetical protein
MGVLVVYGDVHRFGCRTDRPFSKEEVVLNLIS